MARKRYTAEEIIGHLRTIEIETGKGLGIAEACRKLSITEQTYDGWKKECGRGGKLPSPARRREAVCPVQETLAVSERRARRVVGQGVLRWFARSDEIEVGVTLRGLILHGSRLKFCPIISPSIERGTACVSKTRSRTCPTHFPVIRKPLFCTGLQRVQRSTTVKI